MYMVQVLEHAMVNAALVMKFLPTVREYSGGETWEKAFDKFYDVELSQTFGNMIRALSGIDGFPSDLLARLRASKEPRDTLAHRFFWQNDRAFISDAGRKGMIGWCERHISLFETLSDDLDDFTRPYRIKYGISDEWIEQVFARDAEAARTSN